MLHNAEERAAAASQQAEAERAVDAAKHAELSAAKVLADLKAQADGARKQVRRISGVVSSVHVHAPQLEACSPCCLLKVAHDVGRENDVNVNPWSSQPASMHRSTNCSVNRPRQQSGVWRSSKSDAWQRKRTLQTCAQLVMSNRDVLRSRLRLSWS